MSFSHLEKTNMNFFTYPFLRHGKKRRSTEYIINGHELKIRQRDSENETNREHLSGRESFIELRFLFRCASL